MIPLKHKLTGTKLNQKTPITNAYPGYAYTIQAVYYSSNNPSQHLHIFDADGDECIFPLPGDLTPKALAVQEVTIKLPLSIMDEGANNDVTIFGTVERSGLVSNRASMV